jgi:hypothetical protein
MHQEDIAATGAGRIALTESRDYASWLVPVFVWAFGAAIFFRQQITSNFDLISGSIGDARLIIFINEHWFRVFSGLTEFLSPTLFYPLQGTLGYSDAFLLYQIFYTPFRLLGADEFLAFQLMLIGLTAIGFASFFALLRRVFKLPMFLASGGALIFAFSNMIFIVVDHTQHLTIEFIPLLILFGFEAVKSIPDAPRRSFLFSGLMGAGLALVFFTSYYIGWFFVLASLVFVPVLLVLCWDDALVMIKAHRLRVAVCLLVFSASFLIFLTPFLITYLPVLLEGRQRDFAENMVYAGRITDLVNVGDGNMIWGRILEILPGYPEQRLLNAEARLATTPLLLITMIAGMFLVVRHSERYRVGPQFRIRLILALTITALVLQVVSIKVGHASYWWMIWKFVPGASAIRVPFRLQFLTGLTVTLAVLLILDYWYRVERSKTATKSLGIVLTGIIAVLAVEQVNFTPTALITRSQELARLEKVRAAPGRCGTFYIVDSNPVERPFFAYQIDAMLLSHRAGIPTINGYSGWEPDGWALRDPTNGTYVLSADLWLKRHGLIDRACALDVATMTWTPHQTPEPKLVTLGQKIDFAAGGNADSSVLPTGWSTAEPWGRWSDGDLAQFQVKVQPPLNGGIELVAEASAYVNERHKSQEVEILVNDRKVGSWNLTEEKLKTNSEQRVYIPPELIRSESITTISFRLLNPASPESLGISTDNRVLGIAVRSLRLVGAPLEKAPQNP